MSGRKLKPIVLLLFFFGIVFSAPVYAQEAGVGITFASEYEAVAPGSEFFVEVLVFAGTPINAIEFEINYPHDFLEFVSAIDSGSIMDVWKPKPNVAGGGVIALGGGIFVPFDGADGRITRILFRAVGEGVGDITLENGFAYAADGAGTRIPVYGASRVIAAYEGAVLSVVNMPENVKAPILSVQVVVNTISGEKMILFDTFDDEIGVDFVELRRKRWLTWDEFSIAETPEKIPWGVWAVQVRSVNNAGMYSSETVIIWDYFWKKMSLILFVAILLGYFARIIIRRTRT